MKLIEELKSLEAKRKYRELAMKFHPDKTGNGDIMKKINQAKDNGDKELFKIYSELLKVRKTQETKKTKISSMFDLVKYYKWAKIIQNSFAFPMDIVVSKEGNSFNAWINMVENGKVKSIYLANIEKYHTLEQFRMAVQRKI